MPSFGAFNVISGTKKSVVSFHDFIIFPLRFFRKRVTTQGKGCDLCGAYPWHHGTPLNHKQEMGNLSARLQMRTYESESGRLQASTTRAEVPATRQDLGEPKCWPPGAHRERHNRHSKVRKWESEIAHYQVRLGEWDCSILGEVCDCQRARLKERAGRTNLVAARLLLGEQKCSS